LSEVIWERRECVSAEVEDSLVLLDLESLVYHSLNKTAAAVWECLAEPRAASSIVSRLCERFQVTPDHCRTSVDRLMQEFSTRKLVKPHESESAQPST
jgi:hypothetical protein